MGFVSCDNAVEGEWMIITRGPVVSAPLREGASGLGVPGATVGAGVESTRTFLAPHGDRATFEPVFEALPSSQVRPTEGTYARPIGAYGSHATTFERLPSGELHATTFIGGTSQGFSLIPLRMPNGSARSHRELRLAHFEVRTDGPANLPPLEVSVWSTRVSAHEVGKTPVTWSYQREELGELGTHPITRLHKAMANVALSYFKHQGQVEDVLQSHPTSPDAPWVVDWAAGRRLGVVSDGKQVSVTREAGHGFPDSGENHPAGYRTVEVDGIHGSVASSGDGYITGGTIGDTRGEASVDGFLDNPLAYFARLLPDMTVELSSVLTHEALGRVSLDNSVTGLATSEVHAVAAAKILRKALMPAYGATYPRHVGAVGTTLTRFERLPNGELHGTASLDGRTQGLTVVGYKEDSPPLAFVRLDDAPADSSPLEVSLEMEPVTVDPVATVAAGPAKTLIAQITRAYMENRDALQADGGNHPLDANAPWVSEFKSGERLGLVKNGNQFDTTRPERFAFPDGSAAPREINLGGIVCTVTPHENGFRISLPAASFSPSDFTGKMRPNGDVELHVTNYPLRTDVLVLRPVTAAVGTGGAKEIAAHALRQALGEKA